MEDQILYVIGDMEKNISTHHIHVVKWNGTERRNYIHFRDCLNANENMALQYQRVKEELESIVLQDDFSILKFNQCECESVYHV